jgi:membrane protease YdiL (CAAX protease family)
MSRREKILGWIYLPIHVVLLPLLLPSVMYLLSGQNELPDPLTLNVWYYLTGVVVLLAGLFRYFRESFYVLTHNFRNAELAMLVAFGVLLIGNLALTLVTTLLGSLPASPNQDAVEALSQVDNRRMAAVGVIMAPIVEETLFRGVIFGSLRKKSLVAAYAVSVVLFAVYHVWQYVVVTGSLEPLLSAILYVPIAIALAFCYDYSGSIWTAIFFHMFYNALALTIS